MNDVPVKQDCRIKYYEMNVKKALKESVLLSFLQDVATQDADRMGFGAKFVFSNNLGWYLLKYRIEMTSWPVNQEIIRITTEPRGYQKFYAFRDFAIYNEQNEQIGRVGSCWTLVDIQTKKPKNLRDVKEYNIEYKKREDDIVFKKIEDFEEPDKTLSLPVFFDDIDANGHVNNTNYIRWALEALDKEFRLKHHARNIDIIYRKEVTYGNSIISEVKLKDNLSLHTLKNAQTQDKLCQFEIEWV